MNIFIILGLVGIFWIIPFDTNTDFSDSSESNKKESKSNCCVEKDLFYDNLSNF